MSDIDAGPHATPDQVRAAQKRADAAVAAAVRVAAAFGSYAETVDPSAFPPKARRAPKGETA